MRVRNVRKTTYAVTDFLSWQRAKTLTMSPSFQRRDVWPPAAKSYLIDTVVRGLPIPIIYIRERTRLETLEPAREVVDGQQRLRTLISFIEPEILPGFRKEKDAFVVSRAHNDEIAGKTFTELSEEVRRQILSYELSVHVLSPDTDDQEVLEIFSRLNSTGVRLNDQELRNAKFFGELKRTAYGMAYEQLTRWRQWTIFGERDIARMNEVELVSEFIGLMLYGLRGKTQRALNALYKDKDPAFPEEHEVRRRFRAVMDAIDDTIGRQLPGLEFSNLTLFFDLFACFYDLMFGLGSGLERVTSRKLPAGLGQSLARVSGRIAARDVPEEIGTALRGRTTHLQSRQARLNFLRQVCTGDAP